MNRIRRFCRYCGKVISPTARACGVHGHLLAIDAAMPPDPAWGLATMLDEARAAGLQSVPLIAAEHREAVQAAPETGGC